jgi:hypothetical protein
VLTVKFEGGKYSVEGDKWHQGFSILRVLSFMGREGLGNPTKDAEYQVERMRGFLAKHVPELEDISVSAIIVFLAENVVLEVGETAVPVLRAAKLKGYLRSQADKPLPQQVRRQLVEVFDAAAGIAG